MCEIGCSSWTVDFGDLNYSFKNVCREAPDSVFEHRDKGCALDSQLIIATDGTWQMFSIKPYSESYDIEWESR